MIAGFSITPSELIVVPELSIENVSSSSKNSYSSDSEVSSSKSEDDSEEQIFEKSKK
jgi:hypothetical protein